MTGWIWLPGHGEPEGKENGRAEAMKEERGRGRKKVRGEEALS